MPSFLFDAYMKIAVQVEADSKAEALKMLEDYDAESFGAIGVGQGQLKFEGSIIFEDTKATAPTLATDVTANGEWVIVSLSSDNEILFWNSDEGFVAAGATLFSEGEAKSYPLPMGGKWLHLSTFDPNVANFVGDMKDGQLVTLVDGPGAETTADKNTYGPDVIRVIG
jgi:hypothetical protein